jgi:integrase
MARPATGQIIQPANGRGWALRVRAYGKRHYLTLGTTEEGWNRERAERELRHALADIERGQWRPPAPDPEPVQPRECPTFHEFASQWFEANKPGWAERTIADYRWALSHHLLPHFANRKLDAISIEEVDKFKAAKLREGTLAPAQVNKCLKRLSQILEVAEEYGHIDRNTARGKRRRVNAPRVQRPWVEPEQAPSLLEGGSTYMRPVIATLIGAGLRVSEAVALDWSDVNLATGTLRVGKAKTDAGIRDVDLPGGLVDELTEWKMRGARDRARWREQNPDGGDPVFLSAHAGRIRRQSAANVARRLKTAIRGANRKLDELGIESISERVTPHSLRRTYASIRAASGDDPVYIAEQLGHTDIRVTTRYYTKAVKRRAKLSGAYLAEYERALAWATLAGERAANGQQARFGADQEEGTPSALRSDLA